MADGSLSAPQRWRRRRRRRKGVGGHAASVTLIGFQHKCIFAALHFNGDELERKTSNWESCCSIYVDITFVSYDDEDGLAMRMTMMMMGSS